MAIAITAKSTNPFIYKYHSSPDRVEVYNQDDGWLATFTHNVYTVILKGPDRTFGESSTSATVTHNIWVRVLSKPFNGKISKKWLTNALKLNEEEEPDVLAIAMQYIDGAEPIYEGNIQVAGDASYGPLQANGTRAEGSDFNDYLGVEWPYSDGTLDRPETSQAYSLDCSGYIRMVWGYRSGLPLSLHPHAEHKAVPRRAYQIYESGPGIIVINNNSTQVIDLSSLQAGDLVFFDADKGDGELIDHVGMYLGIDNNGQYRFISSRKSIDGPTLGDYKGKSILNGIGLYSVSFRSVRRF
jgi:hypothetical protein